MDGFLIVNKPVGPTSHDVVSRVRKVFNIKKVGHAGTLDPLASGVLVMAIGRATRLLSYVPLEPKGYRFTLCLGAQTTTQDLEGELIHEVDASAISRDDVAGVLPRFTGEIEQVPPMHSAVHHEGRRLYQLARQGIEVERPPRTVTIHRLEIVGFSAGVRALVEINCECSGGTYMRTLCHDIGEALGVGGYMQQLHRTQCGAFFDRDAVSLNELSVDFPLLPALTVLRQYDRFRPGETGLAKVLHGNEVRPTKPPATPIVCIIDGEELVALARWDPPYLRPFLVLN